jgi:hypothetical protein
VDLEERVWAVFSLLNFGKDTIAWENKKGLLELFGH